MNTIPAMMKGNPPASFACGEKCVISRGKEMLYSPGAKVGKCNVIRLIGLVVAVRASHMQGCGFTW